MKHVVVIGGGLGGLTAGALLAKDGYKITLLEQHRIVGGAATTFRRRGGFTVEVGLHEMDAPHTHPTVRKIFTELDVYKHVDFVEPDEFFRATSSSFDFTMPGRREKAISALKARYPAEVRGVDCYFELIDALTREFERLQRAAWWKLLLFPLVFPRLNGYRQRAVREVLDGMIEDEELKLVLNANIGYYHTTPDTFSILYHAFAQSYFFRGGGWYIRGGSQKLSDYLASVIRDNGGDVLTATEAVAIHVNGKKATSVTHRRRNDSGATKADIVISNMSPAQTYAMANLTYVETKEAANSLLSLYLGFRKSLKSVHGKQAYSRFFFRDIANIDDYNCGMQEDITKRGFVFVDYSQIDSGMCKQGKSIGTICTTDFLSAYERMGDEEYRRKKEQIIDCFLGVLEEHYPGIRALVEYAEVSTPRTLQRYLRTPAGTPYGFAPSARQFFRRPRIRSRRVKNLYFVGACVFGGGFSPAISSGGMCHSQIARVR